MSENKPKESNLGTIVMVVVALLLLGGIFFFAVNKSDKKEDNSSQQTQQQETPATTDATKLGPNEVKITAANFDAEVVKSDKLTFVDAFLPTCPHCIKIAPIITDLSNEYAGRVKFGKMDLSVDENRNFAVEKNISGVPAVLVYKDGKELTRIVGERTKEEYKTEIDKYLK